MTRSGRAIAIVPVRLGSQRLPRKALLADSGQPLFVHTWQRAHAARCFDEVLVATDDDEVAAAAQAAGAPVARTSTRPRTGSERCAEAVAERDAALVVDVQGDWPEIDPEDLEALVEALREGPAPVATLACPLDDAARAADPNVVKVVCGRDGHALYFSRAAIPHAHAGEPVRRLRHVGVYGFTRDALLAIPDLPSSGLAETESLEQLRFLENGLSIRVLAARGEPWGIESRTDYDAFLARGTRSPRPKSSSSS